MRSSLAPVFAGFILLALGACTSIPPASEIPVSIANASTPSDHLQIAEYFSQKAASYEAEAAMHEQMARSYLGRPKGDPASWLSHCNSLQKSFSDAAREARALERAHRQLAGNPSK